MVGTSKILLKKVRRESLPFANFRKNHAIAQNENTICVTCEKASCVTISMVAPSISLILWIVESSIWDEWLSSAPVGSSARISLGLLMIALAQAHRCFWPPDT